MSRMDVGSGHESFHVSTNAVRDAVLGIAALLAPCTAAARAQDQVAPCSNEVSAQVVALDQPWMWNRFGAAQPQGMIYALRRDVVHQSGPHEGQTEDESGAPLQRGNVRLRKDKRPRPLVLRMHVDDCLTIDFENLLDPQRFNEDCNPCEHPSGDQPATRHAAVHAIGMQLVHDIGDDGSNVGNIAHPGSLLPPGGRKSYTWVAQREGNHVLYSTGANVGGEGDGGQLNAGLFGMVNVEPAGSVWYRSQLTQEELQYATVQTSPHGHPLLDYNATYPFGHRYANKPVLKILDGSEIFHSDLTAIIADIPAGTYPVNFDTYPNREQSFREFTILYHDEIGAQQAFLLFDDCDDCDHEAGQECDSCGTPDSQDLIEHTLHSVRDGFAINYGSGGIGAEILANRFRVGPVWDCTDCRYEEFFLSAWAVGDPAMIVDVPANTGDGPNGPPPGPKATVALYPDDPSNVYHSYSWDHVKFRIGHGGSKEHHVHHQHTHQWEFTPDSDKSNYLDSQTLGPGSAFTLEMVFNGSGNKNLSVGDSIFHCHFYPHFAQGMWAMWRVHDVFENGTRRLPDGEIGQGTPIPAVVPIPERPMAPMPGRLVTIVPVDFNNDNQVDSGQVCVGPPLPNVPHDNPGYPFFVPGQAGHRPPSPPLDTLFNGGLPRHQVFSRAGSAAVEVHTPYDFTKELVRLYAHELPEDGTKMEKVAMTFHEQRLHTTFLSRLPPAVPAQFVANGRPRVRGAPFADPCVGIDGSPRGLNGGGPARTFKASHIQLDAIFNKVGWHHPQTRITSLNHDVPAYFAGTRAPEPMFIRAGNDECIEYQLTNLVPGFYEFDDFQVRTPTDILGQHIHLVKFDVTASDGAANGWNYEDGSLSPDEVVERMRAFRDFFAGAASGLRRHDPLECNLQCTPACPALPTYFKDSDLVPLQNPNAPNHPRFVGAQTTVQRWYADPLLFDNNGTISKRTLKTVFTHDHFGPSTHQQAGLYAGLIIEDEGTKWLDPYPPFASLEGKASWRAKIVYPHDPSRDYREFLLEFADFQLAYREGSHPQLPSGGGPVFPLAWHIGNPRDPGEGFDNVNLAVNPPGRMEDNIVFLLKPPQNPMPEAVSAADVGTVTVNYRNEPVALRVLNPTSPPTQAPGVAGDLSHVFRSAVTRSVAALNDAPHQWPYSTPGGPPPESASYQAKQGDPFTPLMHVYENDRVQIKVLIGAHEEGHNFSIHGHKWLFEPDYRDSGWRNSQVMGISEHFEIVTQVDRVTSGHFVDYLYQVGSSTDDLWNGIWGLMRAHRALSPDNGGMDTLASNVTSDTDGMGGDIDNHASFDGPCPPGSTSRSYQVHAVRSKDVLPNGALVYNSRSGSGANPGPLVDENGLLYVLNTDLQLNPPPCDPCDWTAHLLNPRPEPLVLRANAGDCIKVTLVNNYLDDPLNGLAWTTLPLLVDKFNANQLRPSPEVGLHPQLVYYDVGMSDGTNVGFNPIQTAQPQPFNPVPDPTKTRTYKWYAGHVSNSGGHGVGVPIEFGASNLVSSDRIEHASRGAIGALIIEPPGSTWQTDGQYAARTSASIDPPGPSNRFREFVVILQSDATMQHGIGGHPYRNLAGEDDPEDTGQKAVNYRTEPIAFRKGYAETTGFSVTGGLDFTKVLNDVQVGGRPETPVFEAATGIPIRFRVLRPAGNQRNHVFQLHGHVWEMLPHRSIAFSSDTIGANAKSFWEGSTMGIGASSHHNIVPKNGAGGRAGVPGEYLWRDHGSFGLDSGLWGLLKVGGPSGGTDL